MTQTTQSHTATKLTPFQKLISSRFVTGAGMWLSGHTPPAIGHCVASAIASLINAFKPQVYWTVYANLRQVMGPAMDEETMQQLVKRVFQNTARNNYDLWHTMDRGREAILNAIEFLPETVAIIEATRQRGQGIIIVGTHTGNFDLGLLALALRGMNVQVLGLANAPTGGFDLMNEMRERLGVHITTVDVSSLREAIQRLRAGGMVLTGVDRPVEGAVDTVEFFGRPATLPTGHVRLALKTNAVILITGAYYNPQSHRTVVPLSPPLEMTRTGDLDTDMRVNLPRVTHWLETYIRAHPDQWAMFQPVWPD